MSSFKELIPLPNHDYHFVEVKVKIKGAFSLILAMGLLLVLSCPVSAGGLTVSGGKIETSVSPESNHAYTMEVANTSDDPMDIGVEVKGYGMSPAQDFIALEPKDDSSLFSALALLDVSPPTFHLEPGKSQIITITSKIPAGIGNGGRYAIVFIHTAATGGGAVGVISAVAARVLLTVTGSILDTTSQITEVSLVKSAPLQPAGVTITVANNGNHHFKPQVQATVRNGNTVVATTSVVAPGWPIIPGYSRQFKLDLTGPVPLAAGTYQVDIEVKDETGNLITKGTFPLELTDKQEIAPPLATTSPPSATISVTPTPTSSTAPTQTPPTSSTSPATSQSSAALLLAGAAAGGAIVATLAIAIGRKRK